MGHGKFTAKIVSTKGADKGVKKLIPPQPDSPTATDPTKMRKPLPKMLDGAVCAQYKRCGKPNCRCARGRLHGPYFYRFRWRAGRVTKVYVPLAKVEEVRAACARYREHTAAVRASDAHVKWLLATIKAKLKELAL